jgi:hypothetical protein
MFENEKIRFQIINGYTQPPICEYSKIDQARLNQSDKKRCSQGFLKKKN